jgi:invasion protein IalB
MTDATQAALAAGGSVLAVAAFTATAKAADQQTGAADRRGLRRRAPGFRSSGIRHFHRKRWVITCYDDGRALSPHARGDV